MVHGVGEHQAHPVAGVVQREGEAEHGEVAAEEVTEVDGRGDQVHSRGLGGGHAHVQRLDLLLDEPHVAVRRLQPVGLGCRCLECRGPTGRNRGDAQAVFGERTLEQALGEEACPRDPVRSQGGAFEAAQRQA